MTGGEGRERDRTTLVLAALFTGYWLVVLALDAQASLAQQMTLGLATCSLLVAALCLSPPGERVQVVSMVGVATCCEVMASLVLGLYRYRLDNLPLYVPAGHGLFFLLAVRLADLAWLQRHRWLVVTAVVGGSTLLLGRGLTLTPSPDIFGLLTWIAFVLFVIFSRYRLLYAVSFTQTMALEFYGTALGLWAWAPIVPILGVAAGNPPAAIGAGYCVMDAIARRLASKVLVPLASKVLVLLGRPILLPAPGLARQLVGGGRPVLRGAPGPARQSANKRPLPSSEVVRGRALVGSLAPPTT